MVKICKISQLDQLEKSPNGCLVDTNILFALNNSCEKFHEDAQKSFCFVREKKHIPVYTNVNIKLEFIDLLRRLIIPKHLMGLYQNKEDLGLEIKKKLESLKDNLNKSELELKTFKLSDWDIKEWRRLLSKIFNHKGRENKNAWEIFCSDYLSGALSDIWYETEKQWDMKLLSYKTDKALFIKEPEWNDMISFVEKFGIGSSDAMILNFFLCSKIPLLLTADRDLLYAIEKSNLFKNKIIAISDTFI